MWSGQPWEPSRLDAVTSMLGRAPTIFLTYQGWDRRFYASDEQQIAKRGAQHVLTWEPNGITLRSIANGEHDAFIRSFAQSAAAWGGRIYLRPMHEMNGSWYSWGRGVNGNTPQQFVAAWRRMHDIFVAAGATNVKWVWSPNVRYGPEYPLADLYPGNAYVDWVGLDGYNWGLDPHLGQPAWQSFEQIFGATYREITGSVAPGKPIMIAETASTENGGDKASWILKTFLTDAPKYPAVRALIWFNQADGRSDFRINSSSSSLAAFKQVMNSAAYRARLP
ncbi:MAG TPA: glycosyl hydrolase [Candidatus Limnocylindria bacterium]|nr:glycosyl hydrolase [Candidatus Limnocylindria bacterium]